MDDNLAMAESHTLKLSRPARMPYPLRYIFPPNKGQREI